MDGINIKRLESKLINSYHNKNLVNNKKSDIDFDKVLENALQKKDIKFSKHAIERMNDRDISVTDKEVSKLESAIDKAGEKGITDALIFLGDKAFIASVKNKTIITTINKDQLNNRVFTNINGAVIV